MAVGVQCTVAVWRWQQFARRVHHVRHMNPGAASRRHPCMSSTLTSTREHALSPALCTYIYFFNTHDISAAYDGNAVGRDYGAGLI